MNRIVGPLLKIILELGRDFFNFFSILFLTLLTFACVGVILLESNENFTTFTNAIVTLLSWTLGSFSFSEVEANGIVGKAFMSFYLIISMVLLLNLLIAVLSSTYAKYESNSIGLYLESLIDILPAW